MSSEKKLSALIGKTFNDVKVNKDRDEMDFHANSGEHYRFFHEQDCCEFVSIEEIIGDLQDLVGTPILDAVEVSNEDRPAKNADGDRSWTGDSFTWTFYRFVTIKGTVTVRWYGTSNGYYSERVDFVQILEQTVDNWRGYERLN